MHEITISTDSVSVLNAIELQIQNGTRSQFMCRKILASAMYLSALAHGPDAKRLLPCLHEALGQEWLLDIRVWMTGTVVIPDSARVPLLIAIRHYLTELQTCWDREAYGTKAAIAADDDRDIPATD